MNFRNIAIIAHVDHGKTTLVDAILRQCRAFAEHEHVVERVMDSMDLERERGITIASKNTAVHYGDVKINICDTPGHADFGGEVERVLSMVDGVVLLVDASEGPLPQTRFVLRKALAANLKVIVCINKIDRPDARAEQVLQQVYDLFIDLGADDDLLDFPVLYAIAREGQASTSLSVPGVDLRPLLDAIVAHVPPPPAPEGTGAQLLVTNLDYDPYVGRLALGRLVGGTLKRQTPGVLFTMTGQRNVKVQLVYTWRGLKRHEVDEAIAGDIVAVAGIDEITVGDTVATGENPQPLPRIKVDEPTIGMTVTINTSPFSGRDGKYLTGRQIKERLEREMLTNVSLRLEQGDTSDSFKLFGRGELQLGILIEQMRREGFELSLSRPEVRFKEESPGVILEPYEEVSLDVPDAYVGAITQQMASRKGVMKDLQTDGHGRTRMTYRVPTRGMIGFRGKMLTETRGEGVINTLFDGWDHHAGPIARRMNGAIVADRSGTTSAYGLFHLQPRGELFVGPGEDVYEGMLVGEHNRDSDLNVNAQRGKQLTNFRTTAADEKLVLAPPRQITLESAMEFIDDDEWIEVTPNHIRLRKRVLASNQRSIVRTVRRDEG